ncbi:MAG: DedA family protein [Crenarchaeota archaeon]|nr:DedA family protein [Thermoproteota archaeon]
MVNQIEKNIFNKNLSKFLVLIIALALAMIILLEIIQRFLVIPPNTSTSDFLIATIVSFTQNITDVMASFGYVGLFLLMLLDASSFPIPSEMILPFAGFLVLRGEMNVVIAVIVATFASVCGSLIDYYIGLKGVNILKERRIIGKVLFSENQLKIVVGWFNKYGAVMVIVSRVIPIFRTLISFPAGAVKMSIHKFITYTAIGSLIWNTLLIEIGYTLGVNWTKIVGALNYLVIIVLVISAIIFVSYLVYRRRRIANYLKKIQAK